MRALRRPGRDPLRAPLHRAHLQSRRLVAPSARPASADARALVVRVRAVVAVVNGSGSRQWALADPDGGETMDDGSFAAGVPVLLAPLPPALLRDVPNLPEQYQPRPHLEEQHRDALLRSPTGTMAITATTTGVSGPAGAGKSTTAIVLARDLYVHSHFTDGVTWLAFGRERTGAPSFELSVAPSDGVGRGHHDVCRA